jgi:hypothetical protein
VWAVGRRTLKESVGSTRQVTASTNRTTLCLGESERQRVGPPRSSAVCAGASRLAKYLQDRCPRWRGLGQYFTVKTLSSEIVWGAGVTIHTPLPLF